MEENIIYSNVASELLEIFKYLDVEIRNRIPDKLVATLEKITNKKHEFKIDKTKTLKEQKMLLETKEILSIIYLKYCCDKEEYNEILETNKRNAIKKEEEKKEKYNPELIFNKKPINIEPVQLIPVEELSWYTKLKNFIIKIFKRS